MKREGHIGTGVVLALVGVFLILRTVTHDDNGTNLVDRITGIGGGDTSAPASTTPTSSGAVLPQGLDPFASGVTNYLHHAGRRRRRPGHTTYTPHTP